MLADQALWARIEAHPLNDAQSKFPFSQRLARDNGWSHRFALKAINEYKRFVYLTCVSRATLTPSDAVDQVWHLHLTYSRDYWEVFCPEVLGRKLHHGPTKGGLSEDARFALAYAETKALYQREFGREPPLDIWPSATERFGQAPFFRRVDASRVFLLPKVIVPVGALIAGGAILAGCGLASITKDDVKVWGIAGAALLIAFVVALSVHSRQNRRRDNGSSGCSTTYSSDTVGSHKTSGSHHTDSHDSGANDGGSDTSSGCGGGCGGD